MRTGGMAHMMLGPFRQRFVDDGNVYDPRTDKQSKFTDADKEALKQKYPGLTNNQCYDFARNAYANHPDENKFREYIGVPHPASEKVINCFNLYFCLLK